MSWYELKARLDALLWRFLQLLEEAEGITRQPLHPEDVLDAQEGQPHGYEGTGSRPE